MVEWRKTAAREVWLWLKWLAFFSTFGAVIALIGFLAGNLFARLYEQASGGDWAGVLIVALLLLVGVAWAYFDSREYEDEKYDE